jgi:membrane protein required for colicin V production
MNPVDLGVIAVVVLSAIFAFARGFVREALSIVAWVGAAAITLYGFNWAFEQIDPHVHNPLLSQVFAGVGLFVGSLIVLTILTGYLARLVRIAALSPIDRTLGFIFGLARGAFILCLAYLLLDLVPATDRPAWIRDAKSAPYLREGADMLRTFLPEQLKLKSAGVLDELLPKVDPKAAAERDANRAMRALATPGQAVSPKPDEAQAPNYRPGDRRDLGRLLGTQR